MLADIRAVHPRQTWLRALPFQSFDLTILESLYHLLERLLPQSTSWMARPRASRSILALQFLFRGVVHVLYGPKLPRRQSAAMTCSANKSREPESETFHCYRMEPERRETKH